MTNIVLPFLLSMFLGRTIDLTTYDIGREIYDPDEYQETPLHLMNSTYTVLQENVFPYSHVGLPADIVLRIKSDDLQSASGVLGLDGLLKETSWKSNSVIIAVTTAVQTIGKEIKKDAPLLENSLDRIESSQTHYIHSQVYGAWSIILYRYKCDHKGQEKEVREFFTSVMGVNGPMDKKAIDLWQKATTVMNLKEDLKDKVNAEVQVYSSVPHSESISSPESILKAVQKFPEDVGMLGKPLYVELKPLHDLNQKFPIVKHNNDLEEYFLRLDEVYDDVRSTKAAMRKWMSGTTVEFTEDEEEKISNLFELVSGCVNLFQSIAREASIYKPFDKTLFTSAYYLYKKGLDKDLYEAENYRQLFLQLREKLDPDCTDDFKSKLSGSLDLHNQEKIEAGEMKNGLEGCKTLCLKEPKCRSVSYTEKQPIITVDPEDHAKAILTYRYKQCSLLFRSSRTAKVVTAGFSHTSIYDRNCLKVELY